MKENLLESLDQPVAEGTETEESSQSFPDHGWERDFNAEVWKTPPNGLYSLAVDDHEGLDRGVGLTIVTRRLAEVETIPETPYAVFREFGSYHFGGLSKPLPPSRVGGDCVAVIPAPDGSMVVAVTDGEGKGTPAAVGCRTIYRLLRSAILSGCGTLEEVLFKLNGGLRRECLRGAVVLAKIGVESVDVAAAGNPRPALVHAGKVEILPASGTLLGCTALPQFDVCHVEIPDGGSLALYSDGVTEAESPEGELFDIQRFGQILDPGRSLAGDLLACLETVLNHCGRQQDDVSLFLIRSSMHKGTPAHRTVGRPRWGAAQTAMWPDDADGAEPAVPYGADLAVLGCR